MHHWWIDQCTVRGRRPHTTFCRNEECNCLVNAYRTTFFYLTVDREQLCAFTNRCGSDWAKWSMDVDNLMMLYTAAAVAAVVAGDHHDAWWMDYLVDCLLWCTVRFWSEMALGEFRSSLTSTVTVIIVVVVNFFQVLWILCSKQRLFSCFLVDL